VKLTSRVHVRREALARYDRGATTMKFKEERPLANPEAALAKLLEIANALKVDHAGRLSVGAINHAFLTASGNGAEYGAAMHRAVADG
jgi:hypothetical protein